MDLMGAHSCNHSFQKAQTHNHHFIYQQLLQSPTTFTFTYTSIIHEPSRRLHANTLSFITFTSTRSRTYTHRGRHMYALTPLRSNETECDSSRAFVYFSRIVEWMPVCNSATSCELSNSNDTIRCRHFFFLVSHFSRSTNTDQFAENCFTRNCLHQILKCKDTIN